MVQNKPKTRNSLASVGTILSIMTIKTASLEPCFKWEPSTEILKASKKAKDHYYKGHWVLNCFLNAFRLVLECGLACLFLMLGQIIYLRCSLKIIFFLLLFISSFFKPRGALFPDYTFTKLNLTRLTICLRIEWLLWFGSAGCSGYKCNDSWMSYAGKKKLSSSFCFIFFYLFSLYLQKRENLSLQVSYKMCDSKN